MEINTQTTPDQPLRDAACSTFSFSWRSHTGSSIQIGGTVEWDKDKRSWKATTHDGRHVAWSDDPAFAGSMVAQAFMGIPYPSNAEGMAAGADGPLPIAKEKP